MYIFLLIYTPKHTLTTCTNNHDTNTSTTSNHRQQPITPMHPHHKLHMPNTNSESPHKSRERRRRRIEMRRRLTTTKTIQEKEDSSGDVTMTSPVYGFMSVVCRARVMEDEICVKVDLCRPEINGFRPVHFFGVFDGHGGHHVSTLCKENMHIIFEEELTRVKPTSDLLTGSEVESLWRTAINRSFERMDDMAMTLCQCDGLENYKVCKYHPHLSLVGSTAVVLLLTQDYIIVANCGDSRAVLCRNGKAMPLSFDHKPDREDERARIEALGGRILFSSNGARVEGDRLLKHVVTSEPEYLFTKRESGDMSLILASDGLWDVLSSERSCEVVYECQQEDFGSVAHRAVRGGALYSAKTATTVAAALLVRLAMGWRSSDNISVIVVDLRN